MLNDKIEKKKQNLKEMEKKKIESTWINLINPPLVIWDWDDSFLKKGQKKDRS